MHVLMAVVNSPVTGVIEGCMLKFPNTCGFINYLFTVDFQSNLLLAVILYSRSINLNVYNISGLVSLFAPSSNLWYPVLLISDKNIKIFHYRWMCPFLLLILSEFFLEFEVYAISYCYIYLVGLLLCVCYMSSYFTKASCALNSTLWDTSITKLFSY